MAKHNQLTKRKTHESLWLVLLGIIAVNLSMGYLISQLQSRRIGQLPEIFQQDPVEGFFELSANKTTVAPNEDVTVTIKVGTKQAQPFNVAVATLQWNPSDFGFKSEANGELLGDPLALPDTSDPAWHRKVYTVIASTLSGGMNKLSANQPVVFKTVTLTAKPTISNGATVSLYHPSNDMPSLKFCQESDVTAPNCTNLANTTTSVTDGKASVTFNQSNPATATPRATAPPTSRPTARPTATPTGNTPQAYYELSTNKTSNITAGTEVNVTVKLATTQSRPFNLAVAGVEWNNDDFQFKSGSDNYGNAFGTLLGLTDNGDQGMVARIYTKLIDATQAPIQLTANQPTTYVTFTLIAKRDIGTSVIKFYNPENSLLSVKFCQENSGTTCTPVTGNVMIPGPNNRHTVTVSGPGGTGGPTATPTPRVTARPTTRPTASPRITAGPTARPTATPRITARPTVRPTTQVTATPGNGDQIVNFEIKLENVSEAGLTLPILVRVRATGTTQTLMQETLTFTGDANGTFVSPDITWPSAIGAVDVFIKGPKHWGMTYHNRTLQNHSIDLSSRPLEPGDLPFAGTQDGKVNLDDYQALVARIGSNQQVDLDIADLDYNGVVNAADRGLLLKTLLNKADEF